ncbi:MAG: TrmH family RNA methyltransferase [Armatimonadetes bacterium]|nr:TrmH family RNA methyltransferase [Armatimonadota bacterium]
MREVSAAAWAATARFPIYGVAVHVRSLYNVGALFRASDAARLSHLYLTGGCGHPARERARIDKTALGSVDSLPWTYAPDPLPVLAGLQRAGITVAALELSPGSRPLGEVTRSDFPLALVVGHETDGVPPAVMAACDLVLSIPTWGRKPSLNVALAYGLGVLTLAGLWAAAPSEKEL